MHRVPAWGPFVISLALMGLAAFRLVGNDNEAMAGVVLGYVASYWLPVTGPHITNGKTDG